CCDARRGAEFWSKHGCRSRDQRRSVAAQPFELWRPGKLGQCGYVSQLPAGRWRFPGAIAKGRWRLPQPPAQKGDRSRGYAPLAGTISVQRKHQSRLSRAPLVDESLDCGIVQPQAFSHLHYLFDGLTSGLAVERLGDGQKPGNLLAMACDDDLLALFG